MMSTGQYAQSHEVAAWRARSILQWLNQSGPRYVEVTAKIVNRVEGDAIAIEAGGIFSILSARQVSFASWLILQQTALGETVSVLVRSDPIGNK